MSDTFIQLNSDGTGKKLDTRTEASNGEHRQVFVVGDPSTNAGVAPVDATKGLAVDLTNSGAPASLPLPTGAATAAKQPALGTAGSASTDVITVQGIASGTAQPVSGTFWQATQPVSGTVTANAGTNLNTSALALDATLTGGTQQTKLTDGTNVANVIANDTGLNGQVINQASKTIAFTTSTPGAQTLLANTDIRGYSWLEIVYTSVGSGLALTGQFSPTSGGTYVNQSTFASNTGSPNGALGTANSTVYTSPIRGNYFQIAVSALTSGTFTGTLTLRTTAPPFITALSTASQSGTWTVGANSATGSAIPANAFMMGMSDSTNLAALRTNLSDAASNSSALLGVSSWNFNGAAWDRTRGNEDVTLLASAARTTTQTSADLVNYNGTGTLTVVLDATVIGTGSVTVTINRKDVASGKYILMLAGAAVITNSTNVYKIGPHIAAVANSIAQDYLPRVFQIVVTANNANSVTYSVGYTLTHTN
jgi:hypothetical protein